LDNFNYLKKIGNLYIHNILNYYIFFSNIYLKTTYDGKFDQIINPNRKLISD